VEPVSTDGNVDPLIRLGVARSQNVEWLAASVVAHEKALGTENILGGFRGTGIHPFANESSQSCDIT